MSGDDKMKRFTITTLIICTMFLTVGCSKEKNKPENMLQTSSVDEVRSMVSDVYTKDTKIVDVINDPCFDGYGRLLFPTNKTINSELTLKQADELLEWYNNVDSDKTVEILNYFKSKVQSGETIFYDIYSEDEKKIDPQKADTGLFFFKGNKGAKTAVTTAGGGFVYVGAIHDSFPVSLELSRKGYNVFAIIYRPSAETGCQDLSRAIEFIHENAEMLEVDTEKYSLWGGSAGATIVEWVGAYGTAQFGAKECPKPAAVIMQYIGISGYPLSGDEAPTYACVGTNDAVLPYKETVNKIEKITANGTKAEAEVFEGLPHGFGLGTGTSAEGWVDHAVSFWESVCEE